MSVSPTSASSSAAAKSSQPANSTVTLKQGDTIWGVVESKMPNASVADQNKVVQQIMNMNNISEAQAKKLQIGQDIKVPANLSSKDTTTKTTQTAAKTTDPAPAKPTDTAAAKPTDTATAKPTDAATTKPTDTKAAASPSPAPAPTPAPAAAPPPTPAPTQSTLMPSNVPSTAVNTGAFQTFMPVAQPTQNPPAQQPAFNLAPEQAAPPSQQVPLTFVPEQAAVPQQQTVAPQTFVPQQTVAPQAVVPQQTVAPQTFVPQQTFAQPAVDPSAFQNQGAPATFINPDTNQVVAVQDTGNPFGQTLSGGVTRFNDPNQITVAQIDTFQTDPTGFNHGQEIARTIESGGVDPSLAGQVNLLQYQVDGNGPTAQVLAMNTARALTDVIRRVQSGQDVDAVNMSLQDFNASQGSDLVRQLIQQLTALNVPVLVAAGNAGPGFVNQLTTPSALVVQSATHGQRNANSGIGNVQGESSTTSFATANLSPRIAAIANSGLSVQQIRALLGAR